MSIRSNCDNCPSNPRLIAPLSDNGTQFEKIEKDQRIKELESTILDLQSELARKKYSLTVACNRVEELEDKLAKCQDIAMGLGIKYNEQQDKLKIAVDCLKRQLDEWWSVDVSDTLEQLGELK